ncbi:OmpA family protein [Rubrivirga sp.]|uniref:OmpA family protein n=1 Tax=Rubrivirga sp. TaxID=1885344 RepID=UPI003C796039
MLRLSALALLVALTGCAGTLDRAIDRAGNVAERAVNRNIDTRTDRAVNGAIDGAFQRGEDAVRCTYDDDACVRQANDRGENVVLVDRDGTPVDRNGNPVDADNVEGAIVRAPGSAGPPRPGVTNTNFDFEPGARTLFQDDFEGTRTGNVPGSIRFIKGEMDVVEDGGNKVLRVLSGSMFGVPMGQRPNLFTLEFDLFLGDGGVLCITTTPLDEYGRLDQIDTCNQATAWMDMTSLQLSGGNIMDVTTGFVAPSGRGGTGDFGDYPALNERYVPVRATVDGTYLKVYLDETRVVNIPNVELAPGNELIFFVQDGNGNYDETAFIDNLRVGGGGQETGYGALQTGDRITARGILFESGSARITGSSSTELSQLLAALEGNPGLRIRIEGHTDSSGGASTNQRLSQQRAQAVADWLAGRGISSSRLQAVGMGEDQPVASNDTASGREQNRRVEIVGL